MCTKKMPTAEVAQMVNEITDLKVSEEAWQFGKWPYSRDNPSPTVSLLASSYWLVPGVKQFLLRSADLYVCGDGRHHGAGW